VMIEISERIRTKMGLGEPAATDLTEGGDDAGAVDPDDLPITLSD
jgi:hypothetical protein